VASVQRAGGCTHRSLYRLHRSLGILRTCRRTPGGRQAPRPTSLKLTEKLFSEYREQLHRAHRRWEAEVKPAMQQLREYLKGNQWPKIVPGGERIKMPRTVANLVFADLKVMIPALALRNPRVFVKPTKANASLPDGTLVQVIQGQPVPILEAAAAKEALANWRWRELSLTKQIRRCLVDALTAAFGIMRIGYRLETEVVKSGENEVNTDEVVRANNPFAVRWSPELFRIDPDARYPDLSDAGWVAFGMYRRVEDLKRDSRYRNTDKLIGTVDQRQEWERLDGSPTHTSERRSEPPSSGRDEHGQVMLWEIWDRRRQRLMTYAEGHDKALQYDEWPQAYDRFPAETLVFTEYPDELYGPPDLYHGLWSQNAYNEMNAMTLNHVTRFVRKYLIKRGAIDPREAEKLQAPVDGMGIEVDGDVVGDAIQPLNDAPIPNDWWMVRNNFRDDHDRITGQSDFVRGVAEKVDTATEARVLQANVSTRVNDSRSIVEDFAVRIVKQLLAIDAQTLEVPAMIPVVGPEGALALGRFNAIQTKETLFTETDVEIEMGSMQPTNAVTRKGDALQLFSIWRNDPLVKQIDLRHRVAGVFADTIPDAGSLILSPQELAQVQQRLPAAPPSSALAPGAPGQPPPPRV